MPFPATDMSLEVPMKSQNRSTKIVNSKNLSFDIWYMFVIGCTMSWETRYSRSYNTHNMERFRGWSTIGYPFSWGISHIPTNPLVMCYIVIESGLVGIMSFSMQNGGSVHRFSYVYQRVIPYSKDFLKTRKPETKDVPWDLQPHPQ